MPRSLSDLRARIKTMRSEVDESRGRIAQLMEQLKTEFECSTVAQAEKLLLKLEKEYERDAVKIAEQYELLETEVCGAEESIAGS